MSIYLRYVLFRGRSNEYASTSHYQAARECRLHSTISQQTDVDCCVHGDEPSGSMVLGNFFDLLSDGYEVQIAVHCPYFQFLKQIPLPRLCVKRALRVVY